MKKLILLSALFVGAGTMYSWSDVQQGKPATTTTVATIKLAEAKASLSKQPARSSKNVLGTADGGI
ncbi:hypothetical protein [Mucilaginibacter galii]|nr:hypothetical protein [Mucilaginibacter galii]